MNACRLSFDGWPMETPFAFHFVSAINRAVSASMWRNSLLSTAAPMTIFTQKSWEMPHNLQTERKVCWFNRFAMQWCNHVAYDFQTWMDCHETCFICSSSIFLWQRFRTYRRPALSWETKLSVTWTTVLGSFWPSEDRRQSLVDDDDFC